VVDERFPVDAGDRRRDEGKPFEVTEPTVDPRQSIAITKPAWPGSKYERPKLRPISPENRSAQSPRVLDALREIDGSRRSRIATQYVANRIFDAHRWIVPSGYG
jgi:hypothetical protein